MIKKADALSFSVGGFEFRTAFVVEDEESFETLQKFGEKYNIEFSWIGETSFKGIVSTIVKCNTTEDANLFFKDIRDNAEQWRTESAIINNYRTLIFFIGRLNNGSERSDQETSD